MEGKGDFVFVLCHFYKYFIDIKSSVCYCFIYSVFFFSKAVFLIQYQNVYNCKVINLVHEECNHGVLIFGCIMCICPVILIIFCSKLSLVRINYDHWGRNVVRLKRKG